MLKLNCKKAYLSLLKTLFAKRTKGKLVLFFELPDINFQIESVHSLSWSERSEQVVPRGSCALSYRIKGSGVINGGDNRIELDDGSLTYFPSGVGYPYKAASEELIVVYFRPSTETSGEIIKYTPHQTSFFENAFRELYEVWRRREQGSYLRAKSLLYSILGRLSYERSSERLDSAYKKLKPAIKAINSEYTSSELSVASLAARCSVSEAYLRRVFLRIYGKPPLEYINGLRIERAKEMLLSGLYSIGEVALSCGFSDSKYFSTAFKRMTGRTPSDYARK